MRSRLSAARLFVAALAIAGCSSSVVVSPSPTATSTTAPAQPSTTTAPKPRATSSPLGAEPTISDFGPLAVYGAKGEVFTMDALTVGTLVITDECVFVERRNRREFVAWLAGTVRWMEPGRIVGANWRNETVSLSAGDRVKLGGGTLSEDVRNPDDMTWVARPNDECLADAIFWSNGELDFEE